MRAYFGLNIIIVMAIVVFVMQADPACANDEIIEQIRVEGLYGMEQSEFMQLFGLTIGDRLDPGSVRRGIKRTFLTNRFENIIVHQDDYDPSSVKITVEEKYVIHTIDIEGLHAIRKKEILRAFLIKKNDYYEKDRLGYAIRVLEERIAAMGYPNTRVSGKVIYNEKKHAVRIKLVIEEGVPLIIKRISVNGLKDQEEIDRALIILDVYTGDVFDRIHINERLRELKNRYKKEGYINPVVGSLDYNDGILSFNINRGDLLVILFKGNMALSSSRLKEETLLQVAEFIDNELIEESSVRIINLYHEKGYAFAQVAPVIQESEGIIEIAFFIYEGPQVYVDKVDIYGNSIDGNLIKDVLSLKEGAYFNPDGIDDDRKILQEFYFALGYRDAGISGISYEYNSTKTGVDVLINVSEGSRILIGGIFLKGNHSLEGKEILESIRLKPLSPYNEISISDARYEVINLYKQKGYLDITVDIERSFSTNRAYLTFKIVEGDQYYFGYTIVRGNRDVRQLVITRELVTKKDDPFNMTLLRKNAQKLHKLGLFSNVDYKVIDDNNTHKDIALDVRESNAGAFEFGIGYGDYEKLRGYVDLSYRNFFGLNRVGKARVELTTISEKYIVTLYEPWLYHFTGAYGPLSLRVGALSERRTEKNIDTGETRYKTRRYGIGANFEMNFAESIKGEVLYSLSQNETTDVQPDVILSREDVGTILISAITPSLIYDSRDHPFNPTRGNLTGLSVEIATRYLGSETDYIKYELKSSFYHALLRRLVLAISLRGGVAEGYGDTEELPLIKRFFLGGRNTVRGYAQDSLGPKGQDGNPVGGNVFLMHNLEMRLHVWKSFGIVGFLDGGNVWLTRNDVDLGEYRFTAGAGLRYMTPVGPFRLDYGHKLDREEGEDAAEIHFSIGHAF